MYYGQERFDSVLYETIEDILEWGVICQIFRYEDPTLSIHEWILLQKYCFATNLPAICPFTGAPYVKLMDDDDLDAFVILPHGPRAYPEFHRFQLQEEIRNK